MRNYILFSFPRRFEQLTAWRYELENRTCLYKSGKGGIFASTNDGHANYPITTGVAEVSNKVLRG